MLAFGSWERVHVRACSGSLARAPIHSKRMDIVTHAMMGTIAASPFLESHPEAATAFVFGSVLPDLDVLSRLFGRRAFLRYHQTTSHALPVIAAIGLVGCVGLWLWGSAYPYAALALALGMAFHSLLDWTNTYGITLLAPFTRRRFCREWVFFIDGVVLACERCCTCRARRAHA